MLLALGLHTIRQEVLPKNQELRPPPGRHTSQGRCHPAGGAAHVGVREGQKASTGGLQNPPNQPAHQQQKARVHTPTHTLPHIFH